MDYGTSSSGWLSQLQPWYTLQTHGEERPDEASVHLQSPTQRTARALQGMQPMHTVWNAPPPRTCIDMTWPSLGRKRRRDAFAL